MKRHLVVCGTGRVGSFVVDVLLGKALHVRATTHRKEVASQRGPIAWTYLDIATGHGVEQAFGGIDRAVLVLPIAETQPEEALARCLREAKRRHLEKVVVITGGPDGAVEECERVLRRSGLRHALLRAAENDDPRRLAATAVLLLTHDDIPGQGRGYPDNPGVLNAA